MTRHPKYHKQQYKNLNARFHNNLRISGIFLFISLKKSKENNEKNFNSKNIELLVSVGLWRVEI